MITIIQFDNIFITPLRSLFCPISLSPFHLQSQTNTSLISVSVDLPVLNISWKWNFCVSGFFRLLWCFWGSSLLQSLSVFILMLSSISFQGCTRVLVCSLVHSQVNGLLGCSHFLSIMNNSLMNILKSLYGGIFSFVVDMNLGVELLGHVVNLCLTFGRTVCSPKWLHHVTLPPAVDEGSDFSTSYQCLLVSGFWL